MPQDMFNIVIDRPLQNIEQLDTCSADRPNAAEGNCLSEDSSVNPVMNETVRKNETARLNSALKIIVDKMNLFCDNLFSAQKEAVAKLSVEIARRILVRQISKGDYQIEEIVKQALAKVPTRDDLAIHLNPKDFSDIQKLQTGPNADVFKGIKFIADINVGSAECSIQTSKGIIKSMIDQQLERIAFALENA
jgi:flagellar biosynthesis/type III secretory pathway protein FliH